jgi:NADPH-dependent 2,4-dienoyl-CoA reductase/sulfur reductase-like enzyme
LRENGFKGRIIMVSQEDRLPYDRPNLSKEYLKGEAEQEWMPLRPPSFFEQHEIELWKKKKVTRVNTSESRLDFEDNDSLKYDKILIATGSIPRRPDIAGINLKHIFTLRSFDDSDEIIAAAKSVKNVVILGASFIATETADSLRHRGLSVTLVAPESVPFEKVLGKEIGNMFLKAHRERGVDFRLGQKVAKFQGNNRVESVILENGDTIQADLVIIGAGVKPATHLLKDVDLLSDGSVKVNEYFSISENAYAAGDIATFPYWLTGSDIRIEHWRTAEQQGRIAGANMAGKKVKYLGVPFFWTTQAGLNFRYVGYATEWDKIIVQGNVIKKVFIAFFVKGENIHAIAGVNQDKEMAKYEELMRNQKLPPLHEL